MLRHCSKIFVSSSLNLGASVQTVPSGEDRAETLAVQLQVRNLRDVNQSFFFRKIDYFILDSLLYSTFFPTG